MSETTKRPKKGKKKANGEGTIQQRPNGTWYGTITVGKKPDGIPDRKTVSGRTKKEVIDKLAELRVMHAKGPVVEPSKMLFSEYMSMWLEQISRPKDEPTTYARYEGLLRLHVLPNVQGVLLKDVTPQSLVTLLYRLDQRGVSAPTRQKVRSMLHAALAKAVELEHLHVNPCAKVAKPKAPEPKRRALSEDQITCLLAEARQTRYYTLILLAITTGLRPGELLGLQWDDVDLDRGRLTVRHTQQELGGAVTLKSPKTASSCRTITLSSAMVEQLRAHRADQETRFSKPPRVFISPQGGPVRNRNFTNRVYKPLLKAAGVEEGVTFHSLRHTNATVMGLTGVSPKMMQARLGHSTIEMTMDIYSHTFPSMDVDVAQRMDAFIRTRTDVAGQGSVTAPLQQPLPDGG